MSCLLHPTLLPSPFADPHAPPYPVTGSKHLPSREVVPVYTSLLQFSCLSTRLCRIWILEVEVGCCDFCAGNSFTFSFPASKSDDEVVVDEVGDAEREEDDDDDDGDVDEDRDMRRAFWALMIREMASEQGGGNLRV